MPQPQTKPGDGLFREEALRHHMGARSEGSVLRLPPSWIRWTYWLVVAVLVAAIAFVCLGTVRQYAPAPAVLRPHGAGYEVLALVPESSRRHLEPRMTVRIEPPGSPHLHRFVEVDEVGGQIVGPSEARGFLGPEIEVPKGPVVLVRAALPGEAFGDGADEVRYHDGMLVRAEVPVQRERILFALLPGLRSMEKR